MPEAGVLCCRCRLSATSLAGRLCFGLCADADLLDDLHLMAEGIEAEAMALTRALQRLQTAIGTPEPCFYAVSTHRKGKKRRLRGLRTLAGMSCARKGYNMALTELDECSSD